MHVAYAIAAEGGPESFVATLVPELLRRGHSASIIYLSRRLDAGTSPFPAEIPVKFAAPGPWHYYLSRTVKDFRAWPERLRSWELSRSVLARLKEINSRRNVDLVEIPEGLSADVLSRYRPVVMRAHGAEWTFRYFCRDGVPSRDDHLSASQARQMKHATCCAISRHLADHLGRSSGMDANSIKAIPYPVDTRLFRPSQTPPAGAPVILSVGRLEPRKGPHRILKAMLRVWEQFPEAEVWFAGRESGFNRKDLLSLIPERFENRVRFLGFLPPPRLAELYRKARIYATATSYETFGYTILEAMASALPVVATDCGAIPELVDHEKTGLLVAQENISSISQALMALLADPERMALYGSRGRIKAETLYDVKRVAAQTISLYESALSSQ